MPLKSLYALLKNIVGPSRLESDMSDELQFHIEARTLDLMSKCGLSYETASRQARIEFGGLDKYRELGREARGLRFINEIRGDLVYGFRQLRHSPAFTLAAVLTLAIGIGANTTIFTVTNGVMLKPVPVPRPEELRELEWTSRRPAFVRNYSGFTWHDDERKASFSYPIYEYIRDHTTAFSGVLAFGGMETMNLKAGDIAEEVQAVGVSGNYFEALGVHPILGRSLSTDDSQPDSSSAAVVLSYGFWQRAFAGGADVIGRSITLNGSAAVVIGVSPKGFLGLQPLPILTPDVFVPFTKSITTHRPGLRSQAPGTFNLLVFARLRSGAGDEAARAETEQLMKEAIEVYPPAGAYDPPQITFEDGSRGTDGVRHLFGAYFPMMMSIAGMILLIACANLAGLLVSRAQRRRREVGTRLAIGASRGRLVRQHLTESLLLSAIGTLVAIPITTLLASSLPLLSPDAAFRPGFDLSLDYRVFLYSAVLCFGSSLLFGMVPALYATRMDILSMLKTSSDVSIARLRLGPGKTLVALQVGLSVVLLVGAGLCLRTVHNLQHVPLGFDPTNILTFSFDPSTTTHKGEQLLNVLEDAAARIESLPGIRSVSFSSFGVLTGTRSSAKLCVPGKPIESVHTLTVSPKFFQTMGMRMMSGRDFNSHDRRSSARVSIVNETFAKRFLSSGGPSIGAFVNLLPPKDQVTCPGEGDTFEVVGVVADAKYDNLRNAAPPTVYLAYLQSDEPWTTFEVSTAGDPIGQLPAIRRLITTIDPNLFMLEVRPQSTYIELFMLPERLIAMLIATMALIALFLACIGLYGTLAYTLSRRIREIGIRMSLGAKPSEVVGMVFRESLAPVGIGLGVGLTAALVLTRFLESILYGVSPSDPASVIAATACLVLTTTVAAIIPARRASHIDPLAALRCE